MSFLQQHKLPPIDPTKGERYPLFTRISLETVSTCTRRCSFCPVDQRGAKVTLMDDNVYASICEQLGALDWAGVVQFFYINEPYLDKRIDERLVLLREQVPNCCVHITSNGEPLGRDPDNIAHRVTDSFNAGANVINLNAYDADKVPLYRKAIARCVDLGAREIPESAMWRRYSPRTRQVSFDDKTCPTGLHDWGGEVDGRIDADRFRESPKGGYCPRPHRHLVIDYNGDVPLCCAMPPNAEKFGNVRDTSLVDLWEHRRFYDHRYQLQSGNRVDQCTGCRESAGAYAWAVRQVTEPSTIGGRS